MAHGIMENDTMFSGNGIRPWHGLGTVIDGTATSAEAIKLANLGWDVKQEPVFLADGTKIDGLYANIRTDTNGFLGTVKEHYTIVQNKEAFAFTDNIIKNSKGIEARYETAGSLFNGKRVFMLVRLPDCNLVGDKVENYLFVSTSHDGSQGLMAGITNVRVVCNNTLQMAERGAQRLWTLRHTASIADKAAEAERSLGLSLSYIDRIKEDAEKMAAQKVNEEKFFKEFFKAFELSEKNKEKVLTNVRDIYLNKDDLQNFKGTGWGIYNAVCDFVSNSEPLRVTDVTKERRMAEFMTGYKMIRTAQDVLKAVA